MNIDQWATQETEIDVGQSTTVRSNPLAVVVVTYNSAEVLPGLLSSLERGLEGIPDPEIVVVDNASTDDSARLAAKHPARPRVIKMDCNGGYAAGINAAVATLSVHADLLVLNPDIRLFPGSARHMRQRLVDPDVGVVVPRMAEEDGSPSLSLRREPSMVTAWSEAIVGGTLASRLNVGEVIFDPELYRLGGTIEWATGAALLVSARARELVGCWDESFFLYSEEVDFMRRVRGSGLRVEYVPSAVAIHIGGDTRADPFLFALSARNRVRDFARRNGRYKAELFRLGVATGEAIRLWRGSEHRAALHAVMKLSLRPEHRTGKG